MPGYEEYLARGVDPATARAWADADADADADDEFEEADPELSAAKYVVRQQPSLITSIAPQTAASLGIGSEQAQTLNETLYDLSLRTGPAPNPAIGRDPSDVDAESPHTLRDAHRSARKPFSRNLHESSEFTRCIRQF